MDDGWSVVLPVKDEVDMLEKSLPSAINLNPDEILIVVDEGNDSVQKIAYRIAQSMKYDGLRILEVAKNPQWRFHQACVRRMGYLNAKYDKIFTFDVDTVLSANIMRGYDIIGKDNVSFVTFRKKLASNGFRSTTRTILYELRRHLPRGQLTVSPKKPFIGIYWLYRQYYLDLVREEEIREIYNGEDVFAQMKLEQQSKYRQVHLDIVGCQSLREENEDLWWRQYQLGLWLGFRQRYSYTTPANLLHFGKVVLQVVSKMYPNILRGYFAGVKLKSKIADVVANRSYAEMIMHSKLTTKEWVFSYPDSEEVKCLIA